MLITAIACDSDVSYALCICTVFTYVVNGVSHPARSLSPCAATTACDARTKVLLILLHTASHASVLVTVISSIIVILELFATMEKCRRGH